MEEAAARAGLGALLGGGAGSKLGLPEPHHCGNPERQAAEDLRSQESVTRTREGPLPSAVGQLWGHTRCCLWGLQTTWPGSHGLGVVELEGP